MSRSVHQSDLKLLWYKSGGRCALCRKELSIKQTGGVIGKMAHIIAHGKDGPRADPDFPASRIDRYENLILLCPNHHAEVDRDTDKWTVEKLRSTKRKHEDWV